MSRHWQPPKGTLWTRAHRSMPAGAKAGLLFIAAACVGVAIGAYQAFGPRDIVDDQVAAP